MGPRRALWFLIAGATLARLVLATSLGPGNDEAYYSLYTVFPDLSYFDQPPMIAWAQRIGPLVADARSSLAPRLGFVLLSAGSTWLLARLTARHFGDRAGVWAAVGLNATAYYGLAAGTFVLPDGPLLFFWLLTVDRLDVALEAPAGKVGPWAAVGLAWGGALLSKYHGILLPLGAVLAILGHPPWRIWLRRPGPYLALILGALLFAPVIAWNAGHDWISLRFQGGRALGSWTPRPDLALLAVAGQMLYLTPWIWAFLALGLWRSWRDRRLLGGFDRLCLAVAVVPLALVGGVALFRPVLPHWSLIAAATLFPRLGRDWADALADRPRRAVRRAAFVLAVPLLLGGLLVGQARQGWLRPVLPPAADPTLEFVGWDQIADRLRPHLGPGTFVFTRYWFQSGHLARELGPAVPVRCYSAGDARGFAFWSGPGDEVGRDGLLVSIGESLVVEPACFESWFARLEPLDDFAIDRAGQPLVRVQITRCVGQTRPFPFGNGRAARPL